MEQNDLIKAMSDEDLVEMKNKYSDNQSIVTLIDGILETRESEAIQAQALKDFSKGIEDLFGSLPHPYGIYNVYARWCEVEEEIEDLTKPEEVEVVDKPSKGGKPAVKHMETRYPKTTIKVEKWVVDVNKALPTGRTSGSANGASKRAIKVFKREGTNLTEVGNFASASKACEYLKLTIGGDSATRVLTRDGYISEPYDGTDYTAS